MNWFLKLTNDDPDYYLLKFSKNNPQVDTQLDIGRFVKKDMVPEPLTYEVTRDAPYSIDEILAFDAMQSLTGGIVISGRLHDILNSSFAGEAQFLEATIRYNEQDYGGFYSINIYQQCECYDLEKSKYDKSPIDGSYDFELITLQTEPLMYEGVEFNLVRSAHDNKIVVSDQVREIITASPINSIGFEDTYEMEW